MSDVEKSRARVHKYFCYSVSATRRLVDSGKLDGRNTRS